MAQRKQLLVTAFAHDQEAALPLATAAARAEVLREGHRMAMEAAAEARTSVRRPSPPSPRGAYLPCGGGGISARRRCAKALALPPAPLPPEVA